MDIHLPRRAEPVLIRTDQVLKDSQEEEDPDSEDVQSEQRVRETISRIQRGLSKIQVLLRLFYALCSCEVVLFFLFIHRLLARSPLFPPLLIQTNGTHPLTVQIIRCPPI